MDKEEEEHCPRVGSQICDAPRYQQRMALFTTSQLVLQVP